jgi:hypothetical protein
VTASAELGYGWLALVVLAFLGWYAIRLYHRRGMARIEMAGLELEGWVRLKAAAIPFFWQCPDCGMPAVTSEGVAIHEDPDRSCCTWFIQQAARARERAEASGAAAGDSEGWRADVWPSMADTEAETVSAAQRAELEGGAGS